MASFEPKPFGKYFLIERLAIGGMAEIYKAKTFGVDGFEKLLAIKKILPHYSADKEFISMLTDEAKLVVRLSHTNIVQIYDLGKIGDDYYISMEFIDGINLREVLNRIRDLREKMPIPVCLYIISEIAKGLDYAHSKRDNRGNPLHIVHRDVSPQNVLLSYEGETKIVDFGIAKAAMNVSQTTAGILKGKITYMSPEQALGKPVDGRTDIFSAGIILYEMITGERLFQGETQFEVLKKIRSLQVTEDFLADKVPAELRGVVAKALAYSVKDRFQTAGDLQIALTRLLYNQFSDFSPKQLTSLMSHWFSPEIRLRKKHAEEEESISMHTREVLETTKNQKSILLEATASTKTPKDFTPEEAALFYNETSKMNEETRQTLLAEEQKSHTTPPPPPKIETLQSPKGSILKIVFIFCAVILFGYLIWNFLKPQPSVEETKPSVEVVPVEPTEKSEDISSKPAEPQNVTPEPVKPQPITPALEEKPVETKPVEEPQSPIPATLKPEPEKPAPKKIEPNKVEKPAPTKNQAVPKTQPSTSSKTTEGLPPPREIEGVGGIRIDSKPRGAFVTVNGSKAGITPVVLTKLDKGKTYQITVSKPGYRNWNRSVTLVQNRMEFSASLEKE